MALNLSKIVTITEIKETIARYSKIIISNFVILTPIYVNLVLLFLNYYNIIIYEFQVSVIERKVLLENFDGNNSMYEIITTIISIIIIICIAAVGIVGIINPETFKNNSSSTSNVNAATDSTSNIQSDLASSNIMSTESLTSSSDSSINNSSVNSSLESSSNEQTSSEVTSSKESSSLVSSTPSGTVSSGTVTPPVTNKTFTSAMWYSYGSDMNFKNLTEQQFKNKINTMFDDAVDLGNDAVICQVRPFADAYYQSSLFPWSSYITGTQGKNPGYDPMAYMIEAAHKRGLQFHAWLNPYRISTSTTNPNNLSSDHIARKWWNDESTKRRVLATDKGLYFNPTIPECQKLIIDGVREIVNNYNVDGIHIDDYFYPTTDADFDRIEYNKYKSDGGNLSQAQWRRANVSTLVQGMYQATHSKSGVVFGVSPSYDFDVNYNEQYADLKHWMSTAGYIDYIVPQIYFGYNHSNSKAKYTNCLNTWVSTPKLSSVKLYIGLGAYKIGYKDDGKSDEWATDKELLAKQAIDAKSMGANGIFIFNYSTLYANTDLARAQRENLKKALKSFE